MGDWIFTVLMWVVLAADVLGLAYALLWDRARGRRRCPKCWYAVDGVPEVDGATTCPECGKVTRKARQLHKTRRRRGLALLVLVPLAGAYASHAYPIVRDHGWWRIAPDLVLIAMVPRVEGSTPFLTSGAGSHALYLEMYHRANAESWSDHNAWWSTGELWLWERWLLRRQSLVLLDRATTPEFQELAARLLALASDDPLPMVAERHRAMVVLAWSQRRYEVCDTYVEIGVAMSHYPEMVEYGLSDPALLPTEDPSLSPKLFLTSFERGVRIHQEAYEFDPWEPKGSHRTTWRGSDGQAFKWWNLDGELVRKDSYYGATPVCHVYEALDPAEWGSITFYLDDPVLLGIEEVRGRPCYHVRDAGAKDDKPAELWIDQQTGLVRQQLWLDTMFHYESAFDVELDDSWYMFDPEHSDRSPLMRRMDKIDALLPGRDLLEPSELGG